MNGRKVGTLLVGLILIAAGALFLASNLFGLRLDWVQILKFTVPVLCIAVGCVKLIRHYTRPPEYWTQQGGRSVLLSGLFWLAMGWVIFFGLLDVIDILRFIGLYWPILLITFGAAKILDHYRIPGGAQVRAAEVFGLVFILIFGLSCNRLSRAHLPLIDDFSWGDLRISLPEGLEGKRFRFESSQELPLEGIQSVQVENLYGEIVIERSPSNGADLRLVTQVRAESQEKADELNRTVAVRLTQTDGVLAVTTNRSDWGEQGRGVGTNMYLHLPPSLPLAVNNGYGQVRISDRSAPLNVTSSYGEVRVAGQAGDLVVTNRGGLVDVRSVTGTVKISNQRAGVFVDGVVGDVDVSTEYDSLRVEHVRGRLTARNHFGTVRLLDIQGEASVVGDGSSVNAEHVNQRLTVRNSHKDVRIRDVKGGLLVETSYSHVNLAQVLGGVTLKSLHSEVTAKDLEGPVLVEAKGSEVRLSGTTGPVNVATSLRRVSVEDFLGPLTIQNEFGDVSLESRRTLADPVKIVNKNGSIVLSLPKESAFRLSAQALGGKIESDFGAMAEAGGSEPSGVAVFEATVGEGGPLVELQTSHSRIRIRKRG